METKNDDFNFVDVAERIYEELKQLSPGDRADVVYHLLRMVDDEVHPDIDAAWAEEIDRRMKQIESGEAKWVDGDEVIPRLRAKFEGKKE